MRLTDADALKAESQKRQEGIERYGEEQADCFYSASRELSTEWWCVEDMIDNAPTIDAVPVVRCKDCKHRDTENGLCEGRGWPMQLVPDDGFCDKGERSEE